MAVIDARSKSELRRLSDPSFRGRVSFAEKGVAICGITGREWKFRIGCFDVDTGSEIRRTKEFRYAEFRTASRAPRLIVSEYGRISGFIDFTWALGSLHRRTVWDFRTGKEIASWRPKQQLIHGIGGGPPQEQPYAFAISADGEYVAEGGSGMLTLYKIEP